MKHRNLSSLAAMVLAAAASSGTTFAQEVRVFQMNPSTGFLVNWSANSNLGPMGAFLQSYSFSGDIAVDFDQNPLNGTARITGSRLRIPNTVVAALMGGGTGTVFWGDVVLDASSDDFTIFPTFPFPTFATNLDLSVSSGFVEISPPIGPAIHMPIDGLDLGSIPILGSFPMPGPTVGLQIESFRFHMPFSAPGWSGTFTHDVTVLGGTASCPIPIPYCPSDPNTPGGGTELAAVGSTSVQIDDFTLSASNAPSSTFGVFIYGQRAGEVPSGSGLLCIGGPLTRLDIASINASGEASMRVMLAQHPSGPAALLPGTHHNFQFWHRAASVFGSTWNYSNAIAVTFCE